MRTRLHLVLATLAFASICGAASAQPAQEPPSTASSAPVPGVSGALAHRQRGPSPESIDACKGKAVGVTVDFTGSTGMQFSGACVYEAGVLAARPSFANAIAARRNGGGPTIMPPRLAGPIHTLPMTTGGTNAPQQ